MEPTLSTPASFRLGQAPLSSWQRPWKFSCSKMAIWKRAGPQHGGHPGPATTVGGTRCPRPLAQHICSSSDLSLYQNCTPEDFKESASASHCSHPSEDAALTHGCSASTVPVPRCSWQRDAHAHSGHQRAPRGLGLWLEHRSHQRGTATQTRRDSSGTAPGLPAQHGSQGSAGGGDRSAVSAAVVGDQHLICSHPLHLHRGCGGQKNPVPHALVLLQTARQRWRLAPAGGAGKGSSAAASGVSGYDLGTQRGWACPGPSAGLGSLTLTLELACCCLEAGIWCSEAIISWVVCCLGRETQHVKGCH